MKPAPQIQIALMDFARAHEHDILIPNFYFKRFEMDLFKLTKSGLVVEYEIKVSRSDFKSDFNKSFEVYDFTNGGRRIVVKNKHVELAAGRAGVNRFWFVVPAGLIKAAEVPRHCGLIEFTAGRLTVTKNAPLIIRTAPEIDFRELARSLSSREWNLKTKMNILNNRKCKTLKTV